MCKPGNDTIFRECRDVMLAEATKRLSSREMRAILDENGGCMTNGRLDSYRKVTVELGSGGER